MSARPSPDKPCSLLIKQESTSIPKESDFIKQLDSKDDNQKIDALQRIIKHTINGEPLPKLLMPVIKNCLHSDNHAVKKHLLLYLETVEKKDAKGTLLHEMILVCNHLKNNLNHPNEYIRGCTLRFLCKMKEPEILESLIKSIVDNLTHRHSYVRKNAATCVFAVYQALPDLIPDAPEQIEKFLSEEQSPPAKKNAFAMLFHCDQARALRYVQNNIDNITSMSESLQLTILELIRKVCRTNASHKAQYLRVIYTLVNLPSHAVSFEAANTLVYLSAAPTAVRAAITAYCQLLQAESDNNVKLIILDRLSQLKKRNQQILSEMLMDILRTLTSPNLDIRRKTLALAMDLVSPRNVDQVVGLLKKELVKTESPQQESNPEEYRKLLVDTMHKCASKYPEVVNSVVHLLMNYLSDASEGWSSAVDVIHFVREIVEEYPKLREGILIKLMQSFDDIRASQVYRVALWILGEYCTELPVLDRALLTLRTAVGTLPLLSTEGEVSEIKEVEKTKEKPTEAKRPVVLSDGTYATQSHVDSKKTEATASDGKLEVKSGGLRTLLLAGEWFLASQLASSLTKMLLRYSQLNSGPGGNLPLANEERAKGLLLLVSLLKLGESGRPGTKAITPDSRQRIHLCVKLLLTHGIAEGEEAKGLAELFLEQSKQTFSAMLEHTRKEMAAQEKTAPVEPVKQSDDLIVIRQLRGKMYEMDDLPEDDESDLNKALGTGGGSQSDPVSKLQRIYQLTGYGDPVYCEAKLNVMEYDIVLDILLINQTPKILQNLTVELHTSGDLKVVDRPQTITMAPKALTHVTANIKVTSTDSGIIFGNIVYDSSNGTEKTVVVLNNIHMDIMDYISPAACTDLRFRHMWAEFEWENKVAVNTDILDLNEYLAHVVKITNMSVMTSKPTMDGDSMFLAANLYARSMFGEDAVLNLSVEKNPSTGKITGYIRIRSKTQGIALSLGDKITSSQKIKA